MKTQNTNKLVFGKNAITELTDSQTNIVIGGLSGYVCSNCIPDPISDKIREALSVYKQIDNNI